MTARKIPMQPIVLDAQRRACFTQNSVVKHLLEQSGLSLEQVLSGGHPPADVVQFLQLLGPTVKQFCEHALDEVTLQQVKLEAVRVIVSTRSILTWERVETGWYRCLWQDHRLELRLSRVACRGTYRLGGRQAMQLPWLEHSDPSTAVVGLTWVATINGVAIQFPDGGSVTGAASTLAAGKRRVSRWVDNEIRGK